MGCVAALSGLGEMVFVPGVRRRAAAWSHAVAAMVLIAIVGASWAWRLQEGQAAVLPWGLVLSWIGLAVVGIAGWHGGKLVFEHQVGTAMAPEDGAAAEPEPQPRSPEPEPQSLGAPPNQPAPQLSQIKTLAALSEATPLCTWRL